MLFSDRPLVDPQPLTSKSQFLQNSQKKSLSIKRYCKLLLSYILQYLAAICNIDASVQSPKKQV